MKDRFGIGVVGTGSLANRGVLNHLVLPDVADQLYLAAVCDSFPGRAKAAAEKYNVPKAYVSYDDLLADPTVDVVIVCTPIGLHYEQGMKAIRAGKHLHFNKTMTTTKAEADEVIEAARKKGVKIVASPGRAFIGPLQRVKEILASGELGRIYWVETGASGPGHEYEAYRTGNDILTNVSPAWYYKRPGGGPMYDMVVYALHTVTAIFGPVKRVTGMSGIGRTERFYKGDRTAVDMDDNTHLLLDFGDNLFCSVFGSFSFIGRGRAFSGCFISGSQGSLAWQWDNIQVWLREPKDATRTENPPLTYPFVSGAHETMLERHFFSDTMHLLDCIRNKKEPAVSAEHARHVIEIIELGYKAAETGRTETVTTTFALRPLTVGPE